MNICTFLIIIILSLFSTGVMAYIATATPIGPWIEPTVVLCTALLLRLVTWRMPSTSAMVTVVSGGSIGGILATALGFSFPTFYFLDPVGFAAWLAHPVYFIALVAGLSLTAGMLAYWLADLFEHTFVDVHCLPFPIGDLAFRMIAAQHQLQQAWQLIAGFVATLVFCLVQSGCMVMRSCIPAAITLWRAHTVFLGPIPITIPLVRLDLFPMYWAIGFVTGHVIAVPLIIGALARTLVLEPINALFFPGVDTVSFVLAFCSGMVLAGALGGLLSTPRSLWRMLTNTNGDTHGAINEWLERLRAHGLLGVCVLLGCSLFLTMTGFSLLAQLYLLLFTVICTYQMCAIAGKIGLAQLGRFATFVMVPALFMFELNALQITIIATFVEVCGGVATDLFFGRTMARLAAIARGQVRWAQLLGIVISAGAAGCIFWLLINTFGLGTPELFAQRAQARALLINVRSFDPYILLIGFIFGYILKCVRANPMMVLGGLLMPLNISLGLIIGGVCTLFTRNKEYWYPLWSGVFAFHSLWMLFKTMLA